MKKHLLVLFGLFNIWVLHAQDTRILDPTLMLTATKIKSEDPIITGAERFDLYIPLLKGKKVGLVVNHTSMVGDQHLLDTLLSKGVDIQSIFAPEHGFRGIADAGAKVDHTYDLKTGLPIISLYGRHKKPTPDQVSGLDIILFDIQDVGARFYTYISTMHYVMEACAESKVPLIILDRPNPNGFYVDGPILQPQQQSFVGLHPVPIVHGMTVGEYGKMINEEGWLEEGIKCNLSIVPCSGYRHDKLYQLPVDPSPNLKSMTSIYLYPSLCLFEGTVVSVGRGTPQPFTCYGHPDFTKGDYTFTPESRIGASSPLYEGKKCNGYDLSDFQVKNFMKEPKLNLLLVMDFYMDFPNQNSFFNNYFPRLAGNDILQEQIDAGLTEEQIRETWKDDLEAFKKIRRNHLIYPDFK